MDAIKIREITGSNPQSVIRFARDEMTFQYVVILQDGGFEPLHACPALVIERDIDQRMHADADLGRINRGAIACDDTAFLQRMLAAVTCGTGQTNDFAQLGYRATRIALNFG